MNMLKDEPEPSSRREEEAYITRNMYLAGNGVPRS